MKSPKKGRRVEDRTVFVLSCDGKYAIEERADKGLLAGLWQFPNVPCKLDTLTALKRVERYGLKPKEILLQVERKHIFTHIEWHMSGIYMEVKEKNGDLVWMSASQINAEAALPTAFRQFWEENIYI